MSFRIGCCLTLLAALAGCSSVTFVPVEGHQALPEKPRGFEVRILDWDAAGEYRVIGTISCQDSASSSIWNWWTDNHALMSEMQSENLERLSGEVREVGGDALIGVKHDVTIGGASGGVGVGMGVGIGSAPVGVGVGTSIFSGNPKIVVTSYGSVGVLAGGGGG